MKPSLDDVLEGAIATFGSQKRLAERAIAQLSDEKLGEPLDGNTNSVAVIMKHMAGNMLSRWTDLLTSDGEKPWRDRDGEFVDAFTSREEIQEFWERGWKCLFETLSTLGGEDLNRIVRVRGREYTVIRAIERQMSHYGYHVGQIVLTARLLAKENWQTLTVPRGGSKEFNQRMSET